MRTEAPWCFRSMTIHSCQSHNTAYTFQVSTYSKWMNAYHKLTKFKLIINVSSILMLLDHVNMTGIGHPDLSYYTDVRGGISSVLCIKHQQHQISTFKILKKNIFSKFWFTFCRIMCEFWIVDIRIFPLFVDHVKFIEFYSKSHKAKWCRQAM